MKVVVLAETGIDEQIVFTLVNATAGGGLTRLPNPKNLRARGKHPVLQTVSAVVTAVRHQTPEAEALIVVVDADMDEPHTNDHGEPPGELRCTYCRIRAEVSACGRRAAQRGHRTLPVVVGIAEPCIENWLLCGIGTGHNEQHWRDLLQTDRQQANQFRKSLKSRKYGASTPNSAMKEDKGLANAHRVAGRIDELEQAFPTGFGLLARQIRKLLKNTP